MLLIHDLHSGDIHVRFAAQHALGRIGKPAIIPLLAFLDNKDNSNFVYEATFALAEMGETGIEPLMVALSANSPDVRSSAARALGSIGEPAIDWLLPLIKHKEGWLRYLAFDAMGESRSARAVEPLIAALNDSDSFIRIRAARGLGKLKDQRAINPLRTRLHNESIPVIRDTIVEALGKLIG
jgi:HEAT repeat protein